MSDQAEPRTVVICHGCMAHMPAPPIGSSALLFDNAASRPCAVCGEMTSRGVVGLSGDAEPRRVEVRSCGECPWVLLGRGAQCDCDHPWADAGMCRSTLAPHPTPPPSDCPLRAGSVVVGLAKDCA